MPTKNLIHYLKPHFHVNPQLLPACGKAVSLGATDGSASDEGATRAAFALIVMADGVRKVCLACHTAHVREPR